ncbi:unnamed protein product [Didymodactylos carnosus]|uniref:V-type proton ATPase subunit G n=1 Tax=Didymodactylos carnosus TaxID=1234261 RepID=A0A813Q126_9BILA|nr:unnamed protein product [Didymodactylos carnosus]CAF1128832.1 unnamed protein product [Didymodactylos carnosus]CAF3541123.1 unnamed protein product [Didymodactylos carnosus]CAF3909720.1 unnamed protein product [Didymodactylos carnosus]
MSSTHSNTSSRIQMDQGIQQLLIAERQAAELISHARISKQELLKRASRESLREIGFYRKQRAHIYGQKLREVTQIEQFQAKLDIDQKEKMEKIDKYYNKTKETLIYYITNQTLDAPIKSHINAKLMFDK